MTFQIIPQLFPLNHDFFVLNQPSLHKKRRSPALYSRLYTLHPTPYTAALLFYSSAAISIVKRLAPSVLRWVAFQKSSSVPQA